MKTKCLNSMVVGLLVLGLLALPGCSSEQKNRQVSYQESSAVLQAESYQSAVRGPTRERCIRVDFEAWYQSGLKKYGVDDFSTESLMAQMDSEIPSVRYFSALLLGHRKEVSAIPRLEAALHDESHNVQKAATEALLKMGNRKGIKVLESFCEKTSEEFDQRDGQHDGELAVDLIDAAKVLADAGEVSAIPHLRKLLGYDESWGVRIMALRSLSRLYEKDAAVLTDIASMQDDEHPQIRKEASEFLQRIESSK
jgi:HEAT repeat protein